jgi:hypothetical protein
MLVFIEFVLGVVTGIYLCWLLKFEEAAYFIFGATPLLAVVTYLLQRKIAASRMTLSALQDGNEIVKALSAIKDRVYRDKALELLTAFKKNLELLEHGYLLLNEAEFYWQGLKALEQATRQIKTVELLQHRWDRHDNLLNRDQANLRALARGVRITRIFIIERQGLFDRSIQKLLQQQSEAGIDVRIAYSEDLNEDETAHSLDFAIYDNALVADRGRENNSYFGKLTNKPAEIEKYLRSYNLAERHAHRMSSEKVVDRLQLFEKLPI